MIPSNTPAVARYCAILTKEASGWVLTNTLINTLSQDITFAGLLNPTFNSASGAFKEDQTMITLSFYKSEAIQWGGITTLTTNQIVVNDLQATPTDGDKIMIQIEVFNN